MSPIKTGFFYFKKCGLLNNRILLAIDYGSSLIKVIYLHKNDKDRLYDETSDHIILQYANFQNEEFENALEWLKQNSFIPDSANFDIHGSGVGCISYKKEIESFFNLKLVHVNESLATVAGLKIALEQIGLKNLLFSTETEANFGALTNNILIDKTSVCDSLLFYCGSMSSTYYFDENGKAEFIGFLNPGGKTFLGLGKCLLNTNNYDEIVSLAETSKWKYRQSKVIEDLNENNISSSGKYSFEISSPSFEQFANIDIDLNNITNEDKALSLILFNISEFVTNCLISARSKKVNKVYLSGNTLQSKLFQREIYSRNRISQTGIELILLNVGYATALGALFCLDIENGNYLK